MFRRQENGLSDGHRNERKLHQCHKPSILTAQARTLRVLIVPVTALVLGLGIIFASAYIRSIIPDTCLYTRVSTHAPSGFSIVSVSAHVPGKCPPPILSIPAKRPPVLFYFG